MTPNQMRSGMEAARDDVANVQYENVRDGAGRVDVVPAINNLDRNIGTEAGQTLQTPNDSVESVLRPFRERLARVNPDDFEAVQRIRGDMKDTADAAERQGYGNRARLIGQAVRHLDNSMEAASPGFKQANSDFRRASQDIDAIDAGRQAATRGRTEDTIPAFQALSPRGQQAFRTGYVDPLIEGVQGPASGVNKARPFSGDAFADEGAAMAPGNTTMQRRLGREMRMFETRNTALGGSKTADNLADADAMGIDPSVVGHVVQGNYGAAVRSLISAGSNAVTGNTPQVRQAVADLLLRNGANTNGAELDRLVGETIRRIQHVQELARTARSGATGAVADAPAATKKPKIFPNRKAKR
ncbi:hypothetical protein [Bradyrhizobium sp. RDM4]|uniref:hypothetical protein n=1 Tax=Bradyrhizobium sp. RDM4 TaxID=3378765 RepID=UPI0038FC533B